MRTLDAGILNGFINYKTVGVEGFIAVVWALLYTRRAIKQIESGGGIKEGLILGELKAINT